MMMATAAMMMMMMMMADGAFANCYPFLIEVRERLGRSLESLSTSLVWQ